jgi:CheY-like chemotaxis protein
VDLSSVVDKIKDLLLVSIDKNHEIIFNLSNNLPAVLIDESQIHQITINLVKNASESIQSKNGLITISTGVTKETEESLSKFYYHKDLVEGQYVFLEIVDNGPGLTTDELQQVFDPFYTTKFIGRGLGLSVVMGIVRGHKGGMQITSEIEKGTKFKIVFPLSKEPVKKEHIVQSTLQWTDEGMILICDDEKASLNVIKRMVTKLGFEVILARNGEDAIKQFKTHQDGIDIVILDYTMPKMSGIDAFKEIHKINPNIPVMLSSGYSEKELTNMYKDVGFASFIQKPYTIGLLSDKLFEIIKK